VLVDWNTGADVRVIENGLTDTQVLGWSPDCRYLAGAVGSYESMDTVVWDVTTSARTGVVPDAHAQPHHITWGPPQGLHTHLGCKQRCIGRFVSEFRIE
jgi:hypothetical protein